MCNNGNFDATDWNEKLISIYIIVKSANLMPEISCKIKTAKILIFSKLLELSKNAQTYKPETLAIDIFLINDICINGSHAYSLKKIILVYEALGEFI